MPSPFPGMDPYLEGYLWPDVHHRLATQISRHLAPQIQPNYVARLEISVIEDTTFEAEIGVMYPDVEIVKRKPVESLPSTPPGDMAVAESMVTTAPLTITIPRVRLVTVEIQDVAANQLVTSIEILSPVNKREPNLSRYREKRDRIREAGVHLLEIDLIRRGTRVWPYSRIPDVSYVITLTRAAADVMSVWPLQLADPLPILPVPLRSPDKDVLLNLPLILTEVYDEAFYHLSIDYQQPPAPPPLAEPDLAWIRQVVGGPGD